MYNFKTLFAALIIQPRIHVHVNNSFYYAIFVTLLTHFLMLLALCHTSREWKISVNSMPVENINRCDNNSYITNSNKIVTTLLLLQIQPQAP